MIYLMRSLDKHSYNYPCCICFGKRYEIQINSQTNTILCDQKLTKVISTPRSTTDDTKTQRPVLVFKKKNRQNDCVTVE